MTSGILDTLYNEFVGFFHINEILKIFQTGDYDKLLTFDGILAMINPILPLILLLEIGRALIYKKFKIEDYKVPFLIFVSNRFISRFISIAVIAYCIAVLEKYAIIQTTFTWYWIVYGYIVWEFSHFIYHFLAHKVRLFWCLHSTHHASESMNLSISYAHFFLEAPYADLIRTSICLIAGVNPGVLFFIMFIDGTWGSFIHIGENMMKDARLGFLNKFILTPSHHRVHHAKNPLYMDTNFCNLLNIWDRVFGTLQKEEIDVPVEYGITREINPNSFWDVYFGEIVHLVRDIKSAPGIVNKLAYIIMPPGWSHTGDHKTASVIRKKLFEEQKVIA